MLITCFFPFGTAASQRQGSAATGRALRGPTPERGLLAPACCRLPSCLRLVCRQFLVQLEEAGDDVGFGGAGGEAVGLEDGGVVGPVGF